MELYVYNRDLVLRGAVDVFDSLRWRRRYFQPGEFELHLKWTKGMINLLVPEHIIARRDAKEAGIIQHIELNDDKMVVRGRFLSSLLARRIVWQTTTINDTAEKAMRKLVEDNCILSRPLPNVILGQLKNYAEFVDFQVSYKDLQETITKIAQCYNLGYILRPDFAANKYVFEVYKGLDRSINQSINPRAIFSDEFENVTGSAYQLACEGYKNVGLVGGTGEGAARTLIVVGNAAGFDRYETFIDAKSIQKEDTMTQAQYEALLVQQGANDLAGKTVFENFESKVNLQSNLVYKRDFDLGDVVTCVKKDWSKAINVRITELEEVFENGIMTITPTFGSPLPELADKLKEG